MNIKDVAELRRRYRSDKSNIGHIYGCFINEQKEIISEFDQSLGMMNAEDADSMLKILKRVLTGQQGRNLCEIEFSTAQVSESEKYKVLSELWRGGLGSSEARSRLYEEIREGLEISGNYMILLANDRYDYFDLRSDGTTSDESAKSFSYIVCAICPIKEGKNVVSYYLPKSCFRTIGSESVLGRAELGFVFPAFEGGEANAYKAMYYSASIKDNHAELADALFETSMPMPPAEQKESFAELLEQTMQEECSLRVVRSVHSQINHLIEEHKSEKAEEPLFVSKGEVGDMLRYCGVEQERVERFEERFDECFGEDAQIAPININPSKQLALKTPEVSIKVNEGCSDMVETRIIDGTKYILIRVEGEVEVNGIAVKL